MNKSKLILITGGSSGIGLATARLAVESDFTVVVVDKETPPSDLVCHYVEADLSDLTHAAWLNGIFTDVGLPGFLVNNAAQIIRGRFEDSSVQKLTCTFNVNTFAPIIISQSLLKAHQKAGSSAPLTIVNISSTNAYCKDPQQFEYSISKAALNGFTKMLSNSYPPNVIRANSLNVAWTLTENEIMRKISDGLADDWYVSELNTPLKRLLTPEEIARHAMFWLGSESYPISGSVIDLSQNGR